MRLQTGKRNQIRIQARLRGHTLVGERRYVFGPDTLRPIAFGRQALHAYRLSFLHPTDGRPLVVRGAAAGGFQRPAGAFAEGEEVTVGADLKARPTSLVLGPSFSVRPLVLRPSSHHRPATSYPPSRRTQMFR